MEELKILILEDDANIGMHIESIIKAAGYHASGVAFSSNECLKMAAANPPDILIADINLGDGPNGFETAEKLYEKNKIPTIFVTANATTDNARIAGEQINTISFLSKPFNDTDIINGIERAITRLEKQRKEEEEDNDIVLLEDRIFLKKNQVYHKVMLDEILWLEADGSYCKLHTEKSHYFYSVNLNRFSTRIGYSKLLRVHNKYMINPEKVDRIQGMNIYIGENHIPVGKKYLDDFRLQFKII